MNTRSAAGEKVPGTVWSSGGHASPMSLEANEGATKLAAAT
jgi:hypothetical protein